MIRLANAHIEVEVDPDRGADILAIRRPDGPNVLATYDWVSPLPASRSTTWGDPIEDWLSEYRGGWQELFPNAGAACRVMDVPMPFHGEVSTARWRVSDHTNETVTVRTPARLPLLLERRMQLAPDQATLLLEETVRLDADLSVPYLWGHHPAFLATDGARIDMPQGIRVDVDAVDDGPHADLVQGSAAAWPQIPCRAGGHVSIDHVEAGPTHRLTYLSGFVDGAGWAAIRGVAPGLGVAMSWDVATFPHAWTWWEIGSPGHPWHGRGRILAIEPHTTTTELGLAAAIERGDAHRLEPGQVHDTWLTVSLFDADDRPVRHVARDGVVST